MTNDGAANADGIALRMPVPAGLYGSSGCISASDGGTFPGARAAGRDIVWDLGTVATGTSRAVQFDGRVAASGLPDGYLVHGTGRVADVVGAAARARHIARAEPGACRHTPAGPPGNSTSCRLGGFCASWPGQEGRK